MEKKMMEGWWWWCWWVKWWKITVYFLGEKRCFIVCSYYFWILGILPARPRSFSLWEYGYTMILICLIQGQWRLILLLVSVWIADLRGSHKKMHLWSSLHLAECLEGCVHKGEIVLHYEWGIWMFHASVYSMFENYIYFIQNLWLVLESNFNVVVCWCSFQFASFLHYGGMIRNHKQNRASHWPALNSFAFLRGSCPSAMLFSNKMWWE